MHLMKLEGLLKVTGTSGDVNEVYLVENCFPKCSDSTLFLQFPFSDTGQHINSASTDLFLLDHNWFKFKDGRDSALQENRGKFQKLSVTFKSYLILKEDVQKKNYKQWLNDEHMNFFSSWMLQNQQSLIV